MTEAATLFGTESSGKDNKYMCKISVIMPAYNCSEFIKEAMCSVLQQTEKDLELIVVNDGSSDKTLEIIESIAEKDSRVKVYSQENSGKPSIVRNKALKLARGEYIAFLDGDDLYEKEKLSELLEIFSRYPDVDLVFHDISLIDDAGVKKGETYLGAVDFSKNVLSKSKKLDKHTYLCNQKELFFFMCTVVTTIYTSTPLIRKDRILSENIYFPEDLAIGEDIDLWFRLVMKVNIAFIDRPLSCYRVYPQSITHSPDRNIYDAVLTHIRNYENRSHFLTSQQKKLYRKRISLDLYNIGYKCNQQGQNREAVSASLKSLRWYISTAAIKQIIKVSIMFPLRKINCFYL